MVESPTQQSKVEKQAEELPGRATLHNYGSSSPQQMKDSYFDVKIAVSRDQVKESKIATQLSANSRTCADQLQPQYNPSIDSAIKSQLKFNIQTSLPSKKSAEGTEQRSLLDKQSDFKLKSRYQQVDSGEAPTR